MNERIDKLIEQCTTHQFSDCVGGYENFDKEKFAELLIRECADLCDRFQSRDVGMQPAECAGAIRNMFGVD